MDTVIDDLGGCKCFQVLIVILTSFVRVIASMSIMMMAFGNYNPGWQCLDNSTTADWNGRNLSMTSPTNVSNDTNECRLYKACSNVQFTPGISTIVTEWQLVCDRSWISSLIISIQMVGVLLGSFLSGYLGDKIGRKRTLVVTTLYHMVVNIIAIFSNSWYMFAVMRFLIGIAAPIIVYTQITLVVEFVSQKWRAAMLCLPTFAIGSIILSVLAMTAGDWKYIQAFIGIGSFIALLPFLWIPESLRWLLVKDKRKDAITVMRKIANLNGKKINETEIVRDLANRYSNQPEARDYTCLQLLFQLLRKGVRYSTLVIGVLCVLVSMIYFAISFSVKSMPGNFFTNLLLISVTDIPLVPISATLPNYIGRKLSIILFLVLGTVSLFLIVGFNLEASGSLKSTGSLICVIVARAFLEGTWDTVIIYTGETFPTSMRSTSLAYTSWTARVGAIVAPYLIPDNPDTYFISYLIMASCALICCSLVLFLPETNGNPLQDVWEVSVTCPTLQEESQVALREEPFMEC